jgi:choline-sulfatase
MKSKILGSILPVCLVLASCQGGPSKPEKSSPQPVTSAPAAAPVPEAPALPKPVRPVQPQNVIMLTVDALRADMPWAGYEQAIAPNLSELAKEAVVYENHRSVSSYTAQTVATWLSGRYASTLYRTGMFFTNYFDDNEWITEAMQRKGITTMAVHAHLYFDRSPGLRQGFDVWQMVPGLSWNAQTDESVTGEKSAAAIIGLLSDAARTKGQFFLWSHLMDPHDQYVKHEGAPDFGKDNRGRYDSEVWFTDQQIGKILAYASTQPWWERTVVIISADHGEAFGEHGMYKHAFELWDVLTRVPLIVRAPGAKPQAPADRSTTDALGHCSYDPRPDGSRRVAWVSGPESGARDLRGRACSGAGARHFGTGRGQQQSRPPRHRGQGLQVDQLRFGEEDAVRPCGRSWRNQGPCR